MIWSLALCPDDTKQDSVVYGAEFGVVFLAKDPRTASIQEGLDCLRLNHLGLEGEPRLSVGRVGGEGVIKNYISTVYFPVYSCDFFPFFIKALT